MRSGRSQKSDGRQTTVFVFRLPCFTRGMIVLDPCSFLIMIVNVEGKN